LIFKQLACFFIIKIVLANDSNQLLLFYHSVAPSFAQSFTVSEY